jgi:hypothetical protein
LNDSGNPARISAIAAAGTLLADFEVAGAENKDWEDLASGPSAGGVPALYIADIGDNELRRHDLVVYRVREPRLSGRRSGVTERAEAFPFRYPDGRHNAEAIFIEPVTGQIHLVTKTDEQTRVYRFPMPLRPGRRVTLARARGRALGAISQLALVTGAAASPDGSRIVIRTKERAIELRRRRGATFESALNSNPLPIRTALERQGEAITYTLDGRSIVTTSEGLPAPISRITRRGG